MVEGVIQFGCSSGVFLISQRDRNGNKSEVGVIPGERDVTQRHTGSVAEAAEVARVPPSEGCRSWGGCPAAQLT